MAKKKNYYQTQTGNMINTGIGNLVGVGMIGATSSMVQGLPAGTAKDIAGIVPGLQSAAMLGPNLKLVNDSMGMGPRRRVRRR
jgi:hypothetical protein